MPLVRTSIHLAAGLVIAATALALAPLPAAARTAFDGQWSVLIVTNTGPCDRAYRYGLAIQDGAVIYQGSAAVNVAGRVANNGLVRVRVWSGQQGASGSGRLSRRDGNGTWQGTGSMGTCSGVWTAERRG
jgi:hypothetical protein